MPSAVSPGQRNAGEFPFVQEMQFTRKQHLKGLLSTTTAALESVSLQYHFFDSTFNVFVFLFPAGEMIKSRVTILPAQSLSESHTAATHAE